MKRNICSGLQATREEIDIYKSHLQGNQRVSKLFNFVFIYAVNLQNERI